MSEIRVRVRIGSLALELPEPLTAGEIRRLQAGVEAELASRNTSAGAPIGTAHRERITVTTTPTRGTDRLAAQIARAVHEGLGR